MNLAIIPAIVCDVCSVFGGKLPMFTADQMQMGVLKVLSAVCDNRVYLSGVLLAGWLVV